MLSVRQLAAIDQLADQFEKLFKEGRQPRIEDYLLLASSELRPFLLRELLTVELTLRRGLGERPHAEEYQSRFSHDLAIIESVFNLDDTDTASLSERTTVSKLESNIDEALPERIGRFVVRRQLGEGGFGRVYLADDPQLDRPVALKVPKRDRFETPEQVAGFIQEARATARLKHELLVTIYDVQESNGLPFIVQQYIDGPNLAIWSAKHRPSYEQMAQLLSEVADAISYAHRQRLTHCDLKLANVIMDQNGKPHVADFGLAVHESVRLTRKGKHFGTPYAMAPEQVRGEGHRLDGRTDIWALGVMMYQLLVSERPFTATDREELFNEIETLDPRPPRQIDHGVPRDLERICLKCLSKRKTDRYNTADDLRQDLLNWLAQINLSHSSSTSTKDSHRTAVPGRKVANRNVQSSPGVEIEQSNATTLPKVIHLPYPSLGRFFKGRDDVLQHLSQQFDAEGHQGHTNLIGLYGLGGVGKTRLCVEYAWRMAAEYSMVLFVVADSPENMRRNLAELGNAGCLNLPVQELTDEHARVDAVLKFLQSSSDWLLILDNADDERAAEAVEELTSRLYGGHTLITTRFQRWSCAVHMVELDLLSQGEAVNFILERTQPARRLHADDAQYAGKLVIELGCLALALEQAAAFILSRRQSFQQYLSVLETHSAQVRTWHDARLMKYPKSLAVAWQTNVDQLESTQKQLLDILAWLAPDPFPLAALQYAVVDTPQVEQETLPGQLEHDLGVLADFSLIRWNRDNDTLEMHRVVQEIIRSRQPFPASFVKKVVELLCSAAPVGDPRDVRTWPGWERLLPHALFVSEHAERFEINVPTSRLLGELGILLWSKALHSQAESLERRALALDEKEFGQLSEAVAIRLGNLAHTLQSLNRYTEAEPLVRRSLEIVEKLLGPEHLDVARELNNLARLLHDTNRLDEAEKLLRRSVAIFEASGEAGVSLAIALSNLAQLLRETDRTPDAEPLLQRALEIDEQQFGHDHPEVAHDLNGLGRLLHSTGRVEEAEALLRRAFEIDTAAYGQEHPDVARDMSNLARVLQDTQRVHEAESMLRRALEINQQYLGDFHPYVAGDLCNLARLLLSTQRVSEGRELLNRSLKIYDQFRLQTGFEHPRLPEARALVNQ